MTSWLHSKVTLYLFLDVWGIKHHYFSSRLVFSPLASSLAWALRTHTDKHTHTHTHTHTRTEYTCSPSLTSPCHCKANDWDPNNTQTPCRLQAVSSCQNLTVIWSELFMWAWAIISDCDYVVSLSFKVKIRPAPCRWLALKRMFHTEIIAVDRCKSHCEYGQSNCHLRRWRHKVTTTSRVAFWQTQPAIFTSA